MTADQKISILHSEKVYYEFEIPAGAMAEITLPSGYKTTVGEGICHFAE